jgi:hypothetical protein
VSPAAIASDADAAAASPTATPYRAKEPYRPRDVETSAPR